MLETSKENVDDICKVIEDCSGLDKIEELQQHQVPCKLQYEFYQSFEKLCFQ